MKKAFTLIEMLVVIGILGLLMSVLVVHVTGGSETARAAQCLSNLGNLARGVQQCGSATFYYPLAGSVETIGVDESQGIRNVRKSYDEVPGWISWNSAGAYRGAQKPSSHVANAGWFTSAYDTSDTAREYCLTNGALWKYVSAEATCYRCPHHLLKLEGKARPNWSYVMNSHFGWDDSRGSSPKGNMYRGIHYNTLNRAERRLLFAELKWENYQGASPNFSTASGLDNDCVLQYRDADGGETISWNHKSGRDKVAHVVFADGHVEKILLPKQGLSDSEAHELTKWLCEGKDYSFDGRSYREIK